MKYRNEFLGGKEGLPIGFGSVISEVVDGKVSIPVEYFVSDVRVSPPYDMFKEEKEE